MKQLMEKIHGLVPKVYLRAAVISAIASMFLAISVFAEDPPSATSMISTAMQNSFTTIVADTMTMISAVLPTALSLVGAMLLIGLGIKSFKKIVNKG